VVNGLFLLVFGARVAGRFGWIRFVVFYLLCGFSGAYGVALLNRNEPELVAGAVAGVAGVLGAYLVLFPRARAGSVTPALRVLPRRLPAWPVIAVWFPVQWFAGDLGAALLGFVVGVFATVPMLRRRPRFAYQRRSRWQRARERRRERRERRERHPSVRSRSSAGTYDRVDGSDRGSRSVRGSGSARGTGSDRGTRSGRGAAGRAPAGSA
jgi:hypothetical protein